MRSATIATGYNYPYETPAQLTCCLMVFAALQQPPQLQQLVVSLKSGAPLVAAAWAPALASLRKLVLVSTSGLHVPCSLHGLTQLTGLRLAGNGVHFRLQPAQLPLSIETLVWSDSSSEYLPLGQTYFLSSQVRLPAHANRRGLGLSSTKLHLSLSWCPPPAHAAVGTFTAVCAHPARHPSTPSGTLTPA